MKNIIGVLALTLLTFFAFAQTNEDIVGQWYNTEKDAIITIFEENNSPNSSQLLL